MPVQIGNQGGFSAAPLLQAIAQQREQELAMRRLALQQDNQDYARTQDFISSGNAQIKAGGAALKGKRDFAQQLAQQREAQLLDTQYKQAQMQDRRTQEGAVNEQNKAELAQRGTHQEADLASRNRIADQTDARQREINAENVKQRELTGQQHLQGQVEAEKAVRRHQIETEYAHKIAASSGPQATDAYIAERTARLAGLDAPTPTPTGQDQNSPAQSTPAAPNYVPAENVRPPVSGPVPPTESYAGAPRDYAGPDFSQPGAQSTPVTPPQASHSPFDARSVIPGDMPFGSTEPPAQAPEALGEDTGVQGQPGQMTAEQLNSQEREAQRLQKEEDRKQQRQGIDDAHQTLADQRRDAADAKRQAADDKKNAPAKAADRFVDNEIGTATDPVESLHRMTTALARFDGRLPTDWKQNPSLAAEVNRAGLAKLADMQAADKNTAALTPDMKDAIAVTEWEKQNAHHKTDKDLSATEIREAIKRRMQASAPQQSAPQPQQPAPVQTAPQTSAPNRTSKPPAPIPGYTAVKNPDGTYEQQKMTQDQAATYANDENYRRDHAKAQPKPKPIPTPAPKAAQRPDDGDNPFAVPSQMKATSAQPVRVNSATEAAKLPKGTKFQTPDGRIIVRQ